MTDEVPLVFPSSSPLLSTVNSRNPADSQTVLWWFPRCSSSADCVLERQKEIRPPPSCLSQQPWKTPHPFGWWLCRTPFLSLSGISALLLTACRSLRRYTGRGVKGEVTGASRNYRRGLWDVRGAETLIMRLLRNETRRAVHLPTRFPLLRPVMRNDGISFHMDFSSFAPSVRACAIHYSSHGGSAWCVPTSSASSSRNQPE